MADNYTCVTDEEWERILSGLENKQAIQDELDKAKALIITLNNEIAKLAHEKRDI